MDKVNLARKRNRLKFKIMGIRNNIPVTAVTQTERKVISQIHVCIDTLLNNWDDNSKALDLNPLPKCVHEHCTASAKYKNNNGDRVCAYHREEEIDE
jgi:hypothetical protein